MRHKYKYTLIQNSQVFIMSISAPTHPFPSDKSIQEDQMAGVENIYLRKTRKVLSPGVVLTKKRKDTCEG